MTYRQILVRMHDLHEMRKSMSYSSLYHKTYEDQCIELNTQLNKLTGRTYIQFSQTEICDAIVEVGLGLKESV
jgi:hypothetical protein